MSTRPTDSVFGVPEPPGDTHRNDAGPPPGAPVPDLVHHQNGDQSPPTDHVPGAEVEWTNAELHSIAGTIEELQRRLEQANSRLSTASSVETTEFEIGRLFVEAQRFSEESLSRLELQIQTILCAAEDKAKEILTEATREALEIRQQAQEAAFVSTKTAQELQSAIAGFTTVNNELVKELGALNAMLTPASERGMSELDRSSSVSESH
jgi:cell division septum initiation protein DivIVA